METWFPNMGSLRRYHLGSPGGDRNWRDSGGTDGVQEHKTRYQGWQKLKRVQEEYQKYQKYAECLDNGIIK